MKIIIAINSHGLRWHVCNAIAKGIVAELTAKGGKYYSLEGARVMVEGVPTRRLFVLFAKFVLLCPIRHTPYAPSRYWEWVPSPVAGSMTPVVS